MSEEFINDFGKNLYYLNQYEDANFICLRIIGRLKCNRIVSGLFQVSITYFKCVSNLKSYFK